VGGGEVGWRAGMWEGVLEGQRGRGGVIGLSNKCTSPHSGGPFRVAGHGIFVYFA